MNDYETLVNHRNDLVKKIEFHVDLTCKLILNINPWLRQRSIFCAPVAANRHEWSLEFA